MKPSQFVFNIVKQVQCIDRSKWCDFSDSWGTGARGYIMNAYNMGDQLNLNGMDKHDAFDLISRNRRFASYYHNHGTGCSHDCSGKAFASGFYIERCGDLLIFIETTSYDV